MFEGIECTASFQNILIYGYTDNGCMKKIPLTFIYGPYMGTFLFLGGIVKDVSNFFTNAIFARETCPLIVKVI